jgi:putative ABC transport system permease protein
MSLRTASKVAWRELRASPGKFIFVVIAVAVGVAALSGVKGFGYGFKGMLLKNAKQLIAADLQAQIYFSPSARQLQQVARIGRKYGRMTEVTETVSMAASRKEPVPQMVSVKAVDPLMYPFYGSLKTNPAKPLRELIGSNSSVIVTPETLLRMKAAPGGEIRIGGKDFYIAGTLLAEPDRLASGFGPGMRILMSREGLARTGLIQFGSRAARRFLFKLNPNVNLETVRAELKGIFSRVFITDYREGSPAVSRAIDNTTTFLSLVSLIALIVGSLGVAMGMYSHLQQKMDTIAIMKAVGARSSQILKIYLLQTLWLGIAGSLAGIAVGVLVQSSFPWLIQRVFAFLPQVPWDWSFSLQGLSVGVLATLLFTIPPLLGIRNVRPNQVLRRNMSDAAADSRKRMGEQIPAMFGVVVILFGFSLIAVWLSGSWKMGAYFMGGLIGSVIALAIVAALLLALMRRVVRASGTRLPAAFRHGFANLYRPGNQARAVLVALGVGVMFTATTYLLQDTVLNAVNSEGPGREGNLFLLDVRDARQVEKFVAAQPGVHGKPELAGYIMAKMVACNGKPAEQMKLTNINRNDLQMVRITTAQSLPYGLQVRQGHWWAEGEQRPELAVSEQARRDFHLKLGDRLTFEVAGRMVDAPLVAVFDREHRAPVRYELVFPQNALGGLPVVYYAAAHVEPAQIPAVEEALFERFPTITVMNLADVLQRIQEAIDQVALVVRFLALFAIAAGIIILCASVAGTRYGRLREVAILKTLGATKGRIRSIFSIEFSILGGVAGLIGAILANAFTLAVSDRFLDVPFAFHWPLLAVVVVATICLANAAGWAASARILDQRPLVVLREE